MSNFLNRDSVEIGETGGTGGRTLSGIAMPWDKVAMVRDMIGGRVTPEYPEAFSPSSTDVSRSQHDTFPVFVGHDAGTEPVGVVKFSASKEALMFDAPLSRTPRANTFLELVNDGAMRSVSIQFRPIKESPRTFPNAPKNPVIYRTEVGLRHLALAPTGYGQYSDAMVTAVRSLVDLDEDLSGQVQAADAAIDAAAEELAKGNAGQAAALITAAQLATDAALEQLRAVDADDIPEAAAMGARMEALVATATRVAWRTRREARLALPAGYLQ